MSCSSTVRRGSGRRKLPNHCASSTVTRAPVRLQQCLVSLVPTYPHPPVTSTFTSDGPVAVKVQVLVEPIVEHQLVGALHPAVAFERHVEIQVAVFVRARLSAHMPVSVTIVIGIDSRDLERTQNVGRVAGAADGRSADRRGARCGCSGSAKTSSNATSFAVAVSSAASLNAMALRPPFLQASAAKWLAIIALAPLPTK